MSKEVPPDYDQRYQDWKLRNLGLIRRHPNLVLTIDEVRQKLDQGDTPEKIVSLIKNCNPGEDLAGLAQFIGSVMQTCHPKGDELLTYIRETVLNITPHG